MRSAEKKKNRIMLLARMLSMSLVAVLFLSIGKNGHIRRNRAPTAREWEIYGNIWSDHIHPWAETPSSFTAHTDAITSTWYLNNISESSSVSISTADIVLQPLLQELKQPMTDAERVDIVNQWICDRMIYDAGYLNVGLADAVVKGKGVCWHYAYLFQILMEDIGVEAETVEGIARGNSHIWNKVVMNGKEYFFDVGWNDAQGKSETGIYKNVWMTKQEIAADHHENSHLPVYAANISELCTEPSPGSEMGQRIP